MRVSTIDGGFRGLRGLGALTTQERIAASAILNDVTEQANRALERVTRAAQEGRVSMAQLSMLRTAHSSFLTAVESHLAQLDGVTGQAQLAEWQSGAEAIKSAVAQFDRQTIRITGEGVALEPWQIGLAAAAGIGVVALGAWYLASARGARRRR